MYLFLCVESALAAVTQVVKDDDDAAGGAFAPPAFVFRPFSARTFTKDLLKSKLVDGDTVSASVYKTLEASIRSLSKKMAEKPKPAQPFPWELVPAAADGPGSHAAAAGAVGAKVRALDIDSDC